LIFAHIHAMTVQSVIRTLANRIVAVEYRDFRYSNSFGQVDLERGSLIGIGLSRLIIRSLQIALFVVFIGIVHCTVKYFTRDPNVVKSPAPGSPEAVIASPQPAIDYRLHPPQHGETASAAALAGALPPPARTHHLLRQIFHPHGT
jgi:hypothetical protein